MDRIVRIPQFFILPVLFVLSIHVPIMIAGTGYSSYLRSTESCYAEPRSFKHSDSANPLAAAYVA